MAAFTTNDSITKVVSSEMNFGQVMLVRGLFAILLVAAFAWHQGALRPLRTLMLKPVALRVFGEIGGTISFMAALAHLPLANTSAIFQALPLAITLGAALILREPVGWRRWSAIVAGFIGVLIIVRPGLAGFSQYLVFGDVPDAMMVSGAAIIVLSGLYAFYRERIRHRALAAESSGFPPDGL